MMKRMRLLVSPGIRLQITLWYTCVCALLLLLVSVVSYANTSSSLYANINANLTLRARQIADGVGTRNGQIFIDDISGALPGLGSSTPSTGSVPNHTDDDGSNSSSDDGRDDSFANVNTGTLVRILDGAGNPIYVSLAAKELPAPSSAARREAAGTPWFNTVVVSTGEHVELYNLPLVRNGLVYGLVQVGTSLKSTDDTLHTLMLGWLLIAPVVLLLGALGSFWLAARAFRPVGRLIRMARHVEAGDLQQRVPVPRPRDELHELAITFNQMIARLDEAFSRQRRFVADASHELRTPVSAIRSMTDVALLNEKSPAEYVGTLWDINAEAERLGRLISDLLVLARSDEEPTPLERRSLRLDLIAADVAAVSTLLATEKSIRLRVETSGPVVVLGDADRLLQAVLNLLQNALTYTPAGLGGSVTVRVWAEGDVALLAISDTGIGIEPEHLPYIFERFYRADTARIHSYGGSGLGLSIVSWVVGAHGGSVSVESRPGLGSTFTIHLPLAPEAVTSPAASARAIRK
jgi:two-component system OmpR family sensor kinase